MSDEMNVVSNDGKKGDVTLESIKKGLLINRIIGLSCFVILAGIFAVAIMAFSKVNFVVNQAEPYVERIQSLDLDGIEKSINEINVFVEKTDFDHVSKVVESVPVDIFEQVETIEGYLGDIASLTEMKDDMEKALENFNDLSESFKEFQTKMEPLLKLFSK